MISLVDTNSPRGVRGQSLEMRLFLLHSYTCKLDTKTKDLETQGSELKAVVHRQSEGIAMRVFQSFGQDIQDISNLTKLFLLAFKYVNYNSFANNVKLMLKN